MADRRGHRARCRAHGAGIGGFLNATFGNAPELIIALLAVNEGLTEVVRGSLTGSVIGNLLLVLGFSLLAGPRGPIDRCSSFMSFGAIALAILLFLIPAIPVGRRSRPRPDRPSLRPDLDRAPARLRRRDVVLAAPAHGRCTSRATRRSRRWSLRGVARRTRCGDGRHRARGRGPRRLARAFAEQVGLWEFFVAAVIVAIVGNAAEHGGAVIVAYRGKITLAAEIALASAAQVAVFLIPAVALLSWLIDPISLSFRPVEIAALAFGLVVTTSPLAWSLIAGARHRPARRVRHRRRPRSSWPATARADLQALAPNAAGVPVSG